MPRMRTAVKVHEIIMAQDPASEVTLHYIRHLIATEAIPVTHVGRKKLVDADQFLEYLAAGNRPSTTVSSPGYGQIRKINL